ncbi:MAG: hypothetical protein IT454_10795 [Planctomycetes bacterium]|nr:hypothetical protein [Planctomycetota bacterium]
MAVYAIDLTAHTATWQAYLPSPFNARIYDVAIRSNGELWASVNTFSNATRGLYTIDLNAYSMTRVLAMPSPPFGLAFGPGTVTSSYCTTKPTSNGCLPLISGAGNASATARHGYTISCSNVRNQATGLLLFGLSGQAALPFGGGTVCVAAPRLRAGVHDSRGSAAPLVDCSGAWSLDFNKWHAIQPWIPAGATICAQWIGRDPGFAPPANYILSDALEFSVIP